MIYRSIDPSGEKVSVPRWDVSSLLGLLMGGRETGKKCPTLLAVLSGRLDKASGLVAKSRPRSGLLCELRRSGRSG